MKKNSIIHRHFFRITIIVIAILVFIRLMLPIILLKTVNKQLAELPGYQGSIEDLRLSLIRGAYGVDGVIFNKRDSATQDTIPFFKAASIDASLEWKSLLKGSLVGEIEIDSPEVRFTRERVEPQTIVKDSSFLLRLADKAMPLAINRFVVENGTLRYIDPENNVDVQIEQIQIVAINLRNGYDSTNTFPAGLEANAKIYDGQLNLEVDANPLAMDPTFKMNAALEQVDLPQLNDFFNAYVGIDVNAGTFGLYAEAEAEEGHFVGYVKPLLKDLDIYSPEDRKDNFIRRAWEAIVGVVTEIFENQPEEQVATKIRLEGSLENPNTNWLMAIGFILRNAFIQALQPGIDHEINLKGVKGEVAKKGSDD